MYLKALYDYGVAHGFSYPQGFAMKPIVAHIVLDKNGGFLDVDFHPVGNRSFLAVEVSKTTNITSGIIWEKKMLVLDERGDKWRDRDTKLQEYYRKALSMCADDVPDVALCYKAITDEDTLNLIREKCNEKGVKDGDIVSFRVGNKNVEGCDEVVSWWHRHMHDEMFERKKKVDKNGRPFIDIVTGEPLDKPEQTLSGKVSGLGLIKGESACSLVCNNLNSGSSYGLSQALCSPIDSQVYTTIIAALNHIIEKNKVVYGKLMVVHWYGVDIEDEDDPILATAKMFMADSDGVEETPAKKKPKKKSNADKAADEHAVKKDILLKPFSGGNAIYNDVPFHILVLGVSKSRIKIYRYITGTYKGLCDNINRWESELSLASMFSEKKLVFSQTLEKRVLALVQSSHTREKVMDKGNFDDKDKALSSELHGIPTEVLFSIIDGTAIDDDIAIRALMALQTQMSLFGREELKQDETKKNFKKSEDILLQWAKVCLIRKLKSKKLDKESELIMPTLNPSIENYAYHMGRSLAESAAIQREAIGDASRDVTQSYFAMFMQTPALAYGSLQSLTEAHLAKIGKDKPKLEVYYRKRLAEISTHITEFPKTMSAIDQSYFALGYRHQEANIYTPKDAGKTDENTENMNKEDNENEGK